MTSSEPPCATARRLPRVSVITVCFNPGPVVLHAIESVQRQDYASIEHIVVDGGSTDGSAELIRSRLREGDVFVSEPDEGIYDAMNKGIRLATGDIIALLNADDRYAHEGVVSRFINVFLSQAVDCVIGDVAFFRGQPQNIVRRYNSGAFRPSRIRWGLMPAHPALILRKATYDRLGLYRTDYRIAADYEFVARAFGKGQTSYVYVPEVFVLMAVGGVSTRGSQARRIINRESVRACRDNGIYTNLPMITFKYFFKVLELIQ